MNESESVGFVIGTEDSTPLNFWVGVRDDAYLQLDDAVVVDTEVPGRGKRPWAGELAGRSRLRADAARRGR